MLTSLEVQMFCDPNNLFLSGLCLIISDMCIGQVKIMPTPRAPKPPKKKFSKQNKYLNKKQYPKCRNHTILQPPINAKRARYIGCVRH